MRLPVLFEPVEPALPESGILRLDHVNQCHIAGWAHETSDPVKVVFIQHIVRCLLLHQVQPDMECGPVVDRGRGELGPHVFVPPDPFAPGAGGRLVAPLADEREALSPPVPDQVRDDAGG